MKCQCKECRGSGVVDCPDCDGEGYVKEGIDTAILNKDDEHYPELLELQKDAKRIISQAKTLTDLRPDRGLNYQRQRDASLLEINIQAERLQKADRIAKGQRP